MASSDPTARAEEWPAETFIRADAAMEALGGTTPEALVGNRMAVPTQEGFVEYRLDKYLFQQDSFAATKMPIVPPTVRDDTAEMVAWLKAEIQSDCDAALSMTTDRTVQAWISWGSNVQVHPSGEQVADTPEIYIAQHVARHDPASVIADCEAKLAVIEQCEHSLSYEPPVPVGKRGEWALASVVALSLAYAYRSRPGWKEHWKP